ncbi:hypothetical protein [Legionella bononiensis]|uniref:Uncharacterized protein n=1 Tax=Legionella bononiensis TaxID=2793102 RepID=A0ABS1W7R5_9GAMM|nr:hypothetical protein [Legionella bononiensis]MBL7480079.1 hypothetical protein [Legionella bononiensis]MBL7525406.1 hypothetical protein [Legionella bononiensis]MBL7561590.1 hypothetical protein [Legionella bononiensis]
MPISYTTSDLYNDLLFTVRYLPKVVKNTVQYGLLGAILGYGAAFVCKRSLTQFAQEQHEAVDLVDGYVPDEEEFLHFSRNRYVNRVTPPISEFVPIYSSIIGAGAGALFALSKVSSDYSVQLKQDREERRLDVMV